jgi:hypothetical protein
MTLSGSAGAPAGDVIAEATRLLRGATAAGVDLRLLGGVAIRLRTGDALPPSLLRTPKDIDAVVPRTQGGAAAEFLEAHGYQPDHRFNTLQGASRMLFFDSRHARQLDVFVGGFEMCHVVPVADRMLLEPDTLPLAELVLTKLQIVELNEKDRTDLYALLYAHEVTASDGSAINARRLALACAGDWGLFHTVSRNLERLRDGIEGAGLGPDGRQRIRTGVDSLERALASEPKPLRWRLRARIGERLPWHQEPEEVDLQP